MTADTAELYWDPFDTDIDTDPYEIWRRLRDDSPRLPQRTLRLLGPQPVRRRRGRPPRSQDVQLGPRHRARDDVAAVRCDTGQMIFLDPPDHTRLRTLVSRAFTPRRIGALEDRIRELCRDFLDAVGDSGRFDYVQDFGARLPAMVIASLLGVPLEDQNRVRGYIDQVFHIEAGRRHDQRRQLRGADRAARLPDRPARSAGRRAARRHAHRPGAVRDRGRRRRRAPPHHRRERRLRQPADQRRHRDGGPPARLGGGRARSVPRPAGRAGRRPRSSSRTPSRSCCASRRPRRCRAAGRRPRSPWPAPPCRPTRRCCC